MALKIFAIPSKKRYELIEESRSIERTENPDIEASSSEITNTGDIRI